MAAMYPHCAGSRDLYPNIEALRIEMRRGLMRSIG